MNTPYEQKQALYAHLLGQFLCWLFDNGYEVTMASGYVQPLPNGDVPGHMHGSAHGDRMAEDLNIWLAGRWMDGQDMSWQAPHWANIGAQWKSYNPICRWGGDFTNKDWNHFSITPDGVRE